MATRTLSVLVAAACLALPVAFASPGDATAAPRRSAKSSPKAEVTFMGYRAGTNGSGTIFVELTETVAVEMSQAGQTVEYKLPGTRVPLKNNKNPLLLRDFDSSALSAVLRPGKKEVSLVITLRGKVTPQHRVVARDKGAVLEIDLPALPAK